MGFPHITEITQIPAEVKLIKCKFDNYAFDISINNFTGVIKFLFMNRLEKIYNSYINQQGKIGIHAISNPELLKKSMLLIKCWSYYEACILGSNVGLLASYALEIVIIYMFNNHSDLFTNEVESLLVFLRLMNNIDWNKKIITMFGCIDIDYYYEKIKSSNNFNILLQEYLNSDLSSNSSSSFIKFNEIMSISKDFERFNFLQSKKQITIDNKFVNIIDPLLQSNNLGKSLNYHHFSKLKKIFEFASMDSENLLRLKKEKIIQPLDYLNSLLKIFKNVIITNNPELFYFYIPQPKIILLSGANCGNTNDSNFNFNISEEDRCEESDEQNHRKKLNNYDNLSEDLIKSFNQMFKLEDDKTNFSNNIQEQPKNKSDYPSLTNNIIWAGTARYYI